MTTEQKGDNPTPEEMAKRIKEHPLGLQVLSTLGGYSQYPRRTALDTRALIKLYESEATPDNPNPEREFTEALNFELTEKWLDHRLIRNWTGEDEDITPSQVFTDLFKADPETLPKEKFKIQRSQEEQDVIDDADRKVNRISNLKERLDFPYSRGGGQTEKHRQAVIEKFNQATNTEERMAAFAGTSTLTKFDCLTVLMTADDTAGKDLYNAIANERLEGKREFSNELEMARLVFVSDERAYEEYKGLTVPKE